MIKEPFKGYFPGFDSSLFTQTLGEIKKGVVQKYVEEEAMQLDGYPALKMKITGEADSKQQFIHVVMVMRQNRFYCITARGLAVPENELLFATYFNSFRFMPYVEISFDNRDGGGSLFSVKAPSPIYIAVNKEKGNNKNATVTKTNWTDYYAFDTSNATTYGISAFGLNKYYWVNGEVAFLNDNANLFFNDSLAVNNTYKNSLLVYKKEVCNGDIISRELLLKQVGDSSYTRVRIMHYADSVFVLNMKGDGELLTNAKADSFFNSFRFVNEQYVSGVFKPKTQLLLDDLRSKDSAVCAGAVAALKNEFKFPARDIKLLLDALLYTYPAEKITDNIPTLIAAVIITHPTEEVIDFIKINYPLLRNKKENIRMLMFNILSSVKTKMAYELLKGIMLNDPPIAADYITAVLNFSNSTSLTASLFPEITVKIKDPEMAPAILDMANMLIDSNKIDYTLIKDYEEDILIIAKKMVKEYGDNNYEAYHIPHIEALVKLLVRMNQKKGNSLLNDLIDVQNYALTKVIIIAMAKNGQLIPEDVFNRYCGEPNRRIELYDELVSIGRQSAFRGKYATQKSFAETFAAMYTDNQISSRIDKDYDVVAVKDETVNGSLSRFYIFKVKCHYSYENISYTCVVGPFSPDESTLSIQVGKEKYILYKVKYDAGSVNSLFDDFMRKIRRMK